MFNYRNIALSLILGLFSFNLVNQKASVVRGLASSNDCVFVEEMDSSDEMCRLVYTYIEKNNLVTLDVTYDSKLSSHSGQAETLGLNPKEDSVEEVKRQILSYIAIAEDGQVSLRVPKEKVTVDETKEKVESAQERFDRLSDEVSELGETCSGEGLKKAKSLLARAKAFVGSSNSAGQKRGNERLDKVQEFLDDYEPEEVDETDNLAMLNCEIGRTIALDDQKKQFTKYRKDILPRFREHLLVSGSIDGISEGEALTKSNPAIAKALMIETSVYTISATIAANSAFILQAENTPVSDTEEHKAIIAKAKSENAEAIKRLDRLRQTNDELSSVSKDAIAFWGDHFGQLQKQAASKLGKGNVADILNNESESPENLFPGGSEFTVEQGPGAYDISVLDKFLQGIRENIKNSKAELKNIINRPGESARGERAKLSGNRVLDFPRSSSLH